MKNWVIKQVQSTIVLSGGYSDDQKTRAVVPPTGEWAPLDPPVEGLPNLEYDDHLQPTTRWVWAGGVVTVEAI